MVLVESKVVDGDMTERCHTLWTPSQQPVGDDLFTVD